ncbi:histidine kinase [Chitinophaga dinghuensis]|uniref:Histidine kinase n=1 Tax=Chitinophaga dinghuensis TaxID=1539050 RepID=A0A327VW62_9BACT|nr:sensor histidine kinase [Chitinophaga dinghuensis]RAJ80237.1 histidine kinase [Chitinophaga dinghuensis]
MPEKEANYSLKMLFRPQRIPYWKLAACMAVLLAILNVKTYYRNMNIENPELRLRFLNWLFSWEYILQQFISLFTVAFLCYVTFNLYYQLSIRKAKLLTYFIALLPLLTLYLIIDQGINYFFYPESYYLLFKNPTAFLSDALLGLGILAVLTVLVVKVAVSNDVKEKNKKLELENTKLELGKKDAEFELLKSQVNPHFLFNSLNYLYSKSLPHSNELSEGILTLSEIMKYAFDRSHEFGDGMVLLQDEVAYIEKFLQMNSLRFGNRFYTSFEKSGRADGARIMPFALITVVENAVKHGDATNPHQPIRIKLQLTSEQLNFSCENQKKLRNTGIPSTKLGISNMKGRLQMTYDSNYQLLIEDTADTYLIKLTIPIK